MEKYSLENYREEPDKKVVKRVIYSDQKTLAFVLNIASGESLPPHTHFDCTVLLQVLAGRGKVIVDGEDVPVKEGDLIQLQGDEEMSVDSTGEETLVLYVTISPLPPEERYAVDADL
ncbi:MAG: cupin domain-containing protein [Halanaerobiales bacterium]